MVKVREATVYNMSHSFTFLSFRSKPIVTQNCTRTTKDSTPHMADATTSPSNVQLQLSGHVLLQQLQQTMVGTSSSGKSRSSKR